MDREKLNKKAEEQANHSTHWSWGDRKECFISGANWLMQQPLSERLTEEEKEKIKELFNDAQFDKKSYNEVEVYAGKMSEYLLITIFDADLFK